MGCNLGSNDSLFYIIDIRKAKMLSRSYIAQEGCAGCCCNRTSDRCGDMVITRCNIRDERSKDIERSTLADGLLNLHVCRDLVKWHMTRSLYHNLHILLPCTAGQLTKRHKLLNLRNVGCILKTSRTASEI